MRPRADAERINAFVSELGRAARTPARLYLTGGATAVLEGWRGTTVDIDVLLEPDLDELLRRIPELKERLGVNVELASPALVDPVEARALYERIEPELYRFPAIDPPSFRARVERELG